jgi:Chloramphenicol 3-O-phosphotransferase
MSGRIVILNGAPRAGKSCLVRAVMAGVAGHWVNLGVDTMMAALSPALQPGIGLRPGGERAELEPVVERLYRALFASILAHRQQGFDVIADLGVHEGHSRPLGIWPLLERMLAGQRLLRVGVECDLDTIMARRNADPRGGFYAAGDGVPEPVRRWQDAVHAGKAYDLVLDMGRLTPEAGAARIAAALEAV